MNYMYDEDPLQSLELKTRALTPPLDSIDHPTTCNYLLNLFLAPDMARYLKETNMSDDIYNLPIHFQKIITEARMEASMLNKSNGALKRLEKLRAYVDTVALGDTSAVIATLNELLRDDDEVVNILGE
ncbi:hypothetical protein INT47_008191 [Mucor saturninus]|uniref:Uncharacterized protein n=1 Tax=Mucor saturninus TaxID=64648 RepID=A0A8H7R2W1_9FUNG|nr:hypothetical protein INT47_008191 [Mucor saturninus]